MSKLKKISFGAEDKQSAVPLEYITFALGDEEYGIDIQTVQELRGYAAVTRISDGSECIHGVANLRGIIVPIIDLRIKLNIHNPVYDRFTVVIVLELNDRLVGVVVDRVSDVIRLQAGQVTNLPETDVSLELDYAVGFAAVDQRMLILLDIKNLLNIPELDMLTKMVA